MIPFAGTTFVRWRIGETQKRSCSLSLKFAKLPKRRQTHLRRTTPEHALHVLEPIIFRKFGGFENIDAFFDFASGYGRMTRFLVQELDPQRI